MKVAFIMPSLHGRPSRDAMAPLCFAVLQAHTPPEVETELLDERIEPIRYDGRADLVALSVETYTARRAYQIAARFRARGVPVVMGGYHPTLLPDEALGFSDAIVVGEGERVWPRLLDDLAHGRLQRVYRDTTFPPLDGPPPDRTVFRGKRYASLTLVQNGRGCRHHCDFCSIHAFFGASLRQRPAGEVADEIARAGGRHVFFVDDNLLVDSAQARALCEALLPLRVRWSCQVSIDVVRDAELVRLMARSGCTLALIGLESLDPRNLRQMRKGWALRTGDYASCIGTLRRAGIMVYGTFVFGYDGDTADTFDATVDFALQQHLFLANFNPLTPTPGTALDERLREEGRLVHERWWLASGYRYGEAAFHPRGMTARELTEGCYRARTRFYSGASIVSRLAGSRLTLRSPRRTAFYLAANLVSRREVHRKQGQALGAPPAAGPVEVTA
jgi:radical SAM superfamily enzyme YgiQ (UPF0313 family)